MISIVAHFVFVLGLGFYLITALQWFSYRFERVAFHFTKPVWHLFYLILPVVVYFALSFFDPLFFAGAVLLYILVLFLWQTKLDKKLVFTPRVLRFFLILVLVMLFFDILFYKNARVLPLFLPLISAFFISFSFEKFKSKMFESQARKKLEKMSDLTIILITASYGKTSIKNFLYQILSPNFRSHKTPRSVNTLLGIIKDINENLDDKTEIYIAEAGARLSGDIAEITQFLKPKIVIVGEIGKQHIEYFKTLENIRKTKLEALSSPNLEMAFLHSSTQKASSTNIKIYDKSIENLVSNLDGLSFDMKFDDKKMSLKTKILGEFNAENITVCVCVAIYLGIKTEAIKGAVLGLKSVEHRLQKLENSNKFIIDDSFNGNFSGMSKSYELVKTYSGRKVIITPGIIEANEEMNATLAKKIDEIFDLVIVTGELNAGIFSQNISPKKLIVLKDKSKMVETLAKETKDGDLVLFSNDAPNFI